MICVDMLVCDGLVSFCVILSSGTPLTTLQSTKQPPTKLSRPWLTFCSIREGMVIMVAAQTDVSTIYFVHTST